MSKNSLKPKALILRREGYSYELIKQRLGVSKSTLCDWLKTVPFKPNKETLERMDRGRIKSSKTASKRKFLRINECKRVAKNELGILTKRDLMLLGIGLYIGEGSKNSDSFLQFTNSDPKVIKLAMCWLKKIFNINQDNFSMRIHTYPDNNIDQTLEFWSNLTKIPRNQFGKIYIDTRTNKITKNHNKLPYATLHIRIRGLAGKYAKSNILRKILAWIDIVESYNFAGIV